MQLSYGTALVSIVTRLFAVSRTRSPLCDRSLCGTVKWSEEKHRHVWNVSGRESQNKLWRRDWHAERRDKKPGIPIETRRQHLAVGRLAASVRHLRVSCGCVGESESARAESVTLLRVIRESTSGLELEQFLPIHHDSRCSSIEKLAGSLESEQIRSMRPVSANRSSWKSALSRRGLIDVCSLIVVAAVSDSFSSFSRENSQVWNRVLAAGAEQSA